MSPGVEAQAGRPESCWALADHAFQPPFPGDKMPGMALALSIIGIAFAAFCVWLTVRIVNRRERWAKRTLAGGFIFALVAGYPLSIGPMWWLDDHGLLPESFKSQSDWFYRPLVYLAGLGGTEGIIPDGPLAGVLLWYLSLWGADFVTVR